MSGSSSSTRSLCSGVGSRRHFSFRGLKSQVPTNSSDPILNYFDSRRRVFHCLSGGRARVSTNSDRSDRCGRKVGVQRQIFVEHVEKTYCPCADCNNAVRKSGAIYEPIQRNGEMAASDTEIADALVGPFPAGEVCQRAAKQIQRFLCGTKHLFRGRQMFAFSRKFGENNSCGGRKQCNHCCECCGHRSRRGPKHSTFIAEHQTLRHRAPPILRWQLAPIFALRNMRRVFC